MNVHFVITTTTFKSLQWLHFVIKVQFYTISKTANHKLYLFLLLLKVYFEYYNCDKYYNLIFLQLNIISIVINDK